ncbi:MAG: lactate racemase domain-containing protein [Limisphaerales bacterium]
MSGKVISAYAGERKYLPAEDVLRVIATAMPADDYRGKRVLLIIPDHTRTAPVGMVFKFIHDHIGGVVKAFDIIIALGTHSAMSEEAICERLEITVQERRQKYGKVKFINHEWNNPEALKNIGTINAEEIDKLTNGLFSMDVPVEVNKALYEYDLVVIIGPVFPHEVVGFSGGNKYLFPGVAGPRILNFFHWLGAVITNPMIIGRKWTPVRRVVDKAGAMVNVPKLCFSLVVDGANLAGIFAGTPEEAWNLASDLSRKLHIIYKDKPYSLILSCAPKMYDELWTGGKCMYKLEPVLADDGELIIYAPHISQISVTHGKIIEEIGYHCRDYFLKQWEKFKNYPWGVLAHSTHVRGIGIFENGVERCRAKVTLATSIPESLCRKINLGYKDPSKINIDDFKNREEEGILVVPKAGEILYRLKNPPSWAGGED